MVAVCVGFLLPDSLKANELTIEQLRVQRTETARHQRRLIFNNDGNEPIYLCNDSTPEELLRTRTAALAGSQVDSIFYCTWSSGFGMFTHNTKVGNLFKTKEDLFSKNRIEELLAAGTDPLKVMVDYGKKNRTEIFWSLRMNDTHDAGLSGYGPVMFRANPLKREHPEWLIGTPQARPKFGGWSAVDYSRPEIRDLAVKYVEEVCQNYDVTGIELDFFRHPVFFKRAAQTGTVCTDQERSEMTDVVQRMRMITEREGLKKGHPILLAVRVPDSVEYSRDSGLDVEDWLQKGLVDLLVMSGYFQLNSWETSVALGHKYGVPVYPSLDESRVKDEAAREMRMTVESYRGRALTAWQAGADGLYLFNSFNPKSAIWRQLGSRADLQRMDQDYFASVRGVGAAAGSALPHRDYLHVATLNPGAPVSIQQGGSASVQFPFACELASVKRELSPDLKLRLQFKEAVPVRHDLTVKLNGLVLEGPVLADRWLEYSLTPGQLKLGQNDVEVALGNALSAVVWTDLNCRLRWPTTPVK